MLFPPIQPTGYARRRSGRGAGDYLDDDWYWDEPGDVTTDPGDGGQVDPGNGYDGDPWTDNGDGSVTDPDGYIFDQDGNYLGWESALGDGSWFNVDGQMFDAEGNWLRDEYLVRDEQTQTWYDPISGEWYDNQGNLTEFHPREAPDGSTLTPGSSEDLGTGGDGFFESVGNFLKNLFGGGGSGGSGGGGSSSLGQAAQARQQQAQQALAKAQQSGQATPAQLALLQRQLAAAQAAVAQYGTGTGSTILIASAVGLGVYALTRRRD